MASGIKAFFEKNYGLQADKIIRLEGYSNENYKIETARRNFVLKLYVVEPNLIEILHAESEALKKLSVDNPGFFPVPEKTLSGKLLFYSKKQDRIVRLLSFLEGERLDKVKYTPELLFSFGKTLARANKSLLDFRNSAIESRRSVWDFQHYYLNKKYLRHIKDPAKRKFVEYVFLQTKELIEPRFEDLRKAAIQGDANERNVLANNGKVSGIIDFGDMFYSPLIGDLAIALSYAAFYVKNPIYDLLPLIEGYNKVIPLEEKEVEILHYLIALRLSISVCNSANAASEMPDNKYTLVSEIRAWEVLEKWFCLNPLLVEDEFRKTAGFDSKISDTIEKDLALRHRHTSNALSLHFSVPVKMSGAAFQYMYDSQGKTYLDCYNNIPQVGHCHPRVVEAGQHAMARLNTNTRYLNDVYNSYAENLLANFPTPLNKVFFVNSGSAASDLAVRLAVVHTQKQGIVVMEHGYHGNTKLGVDISHYKYDRKGGSGKSGMIVEAEIPDTYKGRFINNNGTAGCEYANEAKIKIEKNNLPVAAFIAEPIVGCGGQIPLAKDYLKNMYPFIRKQGGVCISDEVQTGFGRLGEFFWGFEMHGVIPDIVIIGKPMGNGHPMAAVVSTDEIAESFETGMEFFSSFGGNPVSCAIGQEVLDVLRDEDLPGNAKAVGTYLLELFRSLVEKYDVCGDARGEGLFLGLELVKTQESKEPNTELAAYLKNELKKLGIMVGTDGPFDNTIKIKPPICFTKENADQLAESIDLVLRKHKKQ